MLLQSSLELHSADSRSKTQSSVSTRLHVGMTVGIFWN